MQNIFPFQWCSTCHSDLLSQQDAQEQFSLQPKNYNSNYLHKKKLFSSRSDHTTRPESIRPNCPPAQQLHRRQSQTQHLKRTLQSPLRQNGLLMNQVLRCSSQTMLFLSPLRSPVPNGLMTPTARRDNEENRPSITEYTEKGVIGVMFSYHAIPNSRRTDETINKQLLSPRVRFEYRSKDKNEGKRRQNAQTETQGNHFEIERGVIEACYVPQTETKQKQRQVEFKEVEQVNVCTQKTLPMITERKLSAKQDCENTLEMLMIPLGKEIRWRVSEDIKSYAEEVQKAQKGRYTFKRLKRMKSKGDMSYPVRKHQKNMTTFTVTHEIQPEPGQRCQFRTVQTIKSIAETMSEGSIIDSNFMQTIGEYRQLMRLT